MVKEKPRQLAPKRTFASRFKEDWQLYALMILPLIHVLLFKYGAYTGLATAFFDYKVASGFGDFAGFDYFIKIFGHRDFARAVRNTLLLNVLDLIFSFPIQKYFVQGTMVGAVKE